MLCEVISIKTEVDQWRLLVEAIAAAHVGFYLKNSEDMQFSKSTPFFVVAVYLNVNLIAERYVVIQIAASGKQVSIAQVNYDLLQSDQVLDFLREMYNYQEKMTTFAEELNVAKKGVLRDVEKLTGDLPSLTRQRKVAKRIGTLHSIQEDSSEHALGAKRTPFMDDPEIIEQLDAMDYRVDMVLFGVCMKTLYSSSIDFSAHLVEGVAFIHKHSVAHRDIKPENVLIPPDGGRLSIIDYSIAIFADGCGNKSCGMVGTEGYMAPEVTVGDDYDAMCADLWSSGKTLEVLCSLCSPSMQSAFIVKVSRELMAADPLVRPTMSDVLTHMAGFDSLPSERPQIRFTSPLIVAEARS
ncbi:kinase-like domain-containing protein [Butyriboletus roseoflavus]|nr:kinase-like domain-containing protein [Butyriboletus roseoflavus]